jgi:hypothetical protein
MSSVGLKEVNAVNDPLLAHMTSLIITNMPVGDSTALKIQCQSSVWPGYINESAIMTLHGISVPFAGGATYEQDFPASFVVTRDQLSRDSLYAWMEFCKSVRNNTGAYAVDYKGIADLVMYDAAHRPVRTCRMFGFYPDRIDSIQLSGESRNELIRVNANFKYTYTSEEG